MVTLNVHKINTHFVLSKYHLLDKNLSLRAKGLLSILFCLTDSDDYVSEDFPNCILGFCGDTAEEINSTLSELCECGYLILDETGYGLTENPIERRG